MDDDRKRPTTDQPLNASPRPQVTPILAVLGVLVFIALIFAAVSLLRYNT